MNKNHPLIIFAIVAIAGSVALMLLKPVDTTKFGSGQSGVIGFCEHYSQGFQKGFDNCILQMKEEGRL